MCTQNNNNNHISASTSSLSLSTTHSSYITTKLFPQKSRSECQQLLDQDNFFPSQTYSDRIGFGRKAQGIGGGGSGSGDDGFLRPDDPRLTKTYAEFPLHSWDRLIDEATKILRIENDDVNENGSSETKSYDEQTLDFVDMGSGLGRIVLYATLSRPNWSVHGIEISSTLNDKAIEIAEKAVDTELLVPYHNGDDSINHQDASVSSLSYHVGSVLASDEESYDLSIITSTTTPLSRSNEISKVLSKADLIFSYSTTFPARKFDPSIGTLVLDADWSSSLADACQNGCIAVTTDRALDPAFGWEFLKRVEVDNQDVFGTSGFISILRK